MKKITLAIHGGAGTILRSSMSPEKEEGYKSALKESLDAGFAILKRGGCSLDAVQAAVVRLEDNLLFNAGRGSVFTHNGSHEMDASIMDGLTMKAGAVAGVQGIRNPVLLARSIMDNSEFVFLSGKGAEDFARENNLRFEKDDYFFSQSRFDQLLESREQGSILLDHSDKNPAAKTDNKYGTVGAVALDAEGNLAAATSTGGMTNKNYNRIGDTPLIGSGNYANNSTCAVSCTGHGEYFIRAVVAYDISCLMEYKGLSLHEACDIVVNKKLVTMGGEGGLIAVDIHGNIELPFNSMGMYRGFVSDTDEFIGIYK